MPTPTSGAELLELFGDIEASGYVDAVYLSDTAVGFSIQRKYPPDIRFKPAKKADGEDDSIAVIWVVYESHNAQNPAGPIPIRLRISTMSRYRALHWDYDFEDVNSPTKESISESKQSPQPLEMTLNGEYFYSPGTDKLIDSSGNEVTGVQILNSIFKAHCDSVHLIKGIRWKAPHLFTQICRRSFDWAINSCIWLLRTIFGRTVDERRDRSAFLDGYLKEDFKKISIDSIELAGYRASKRVILLFTMLVVLGCIASLPAPEDSYLESLISSDFLLLLHSLFALFILDELLPNFFFWVLNRLIRARKWYLNRLVRRSIL